MFLDDDDDDDDITFIGASEPKPSKRPSVVVIDDNGDSDDDIKPITSSQASRPRECLCTLSLTMQHLLRGSLAGRACRLQIA